MSTLSRTVFNITDKTSSCNTVNKVFPQRRAIFMQLEYSTIYTTYEKPDTSFHFRIIPTNLDERFVFFRVKKIII